jgi:hypothetical protein
VRTRREASQLVDGSGARGPQVLEDRIVIALEPLRRTQGDACRGADRIRHLQRMTAPGLRPATRTMAAVDLELAEDRLARNIGLELLDHVIFDHSTPTFVIFYGIAAGGACATFGDAFSD